MPVTVVLAVGLDPWLLSMKSSAWKSHGYVVISVATVREAIDHFRAGDFDLVLLGNAITSEKKEQLTSLIRVFSKRTPIVCVSDDSAGREMYPEATFPGDSSKLFAGLRDFLSTETGLHARPLVV